MTTPEINLQLAPQEVQYILNVLAERPYRECNEVIGKIMGQANPQMAAVQQEVRGD